MRCWRSGRSGTSRSCRCSPACSAPRRANPSPASRLRSACSASTARHISHISSTRCALRSPTSGSRSSFVRQRRPLCARRRRTRGCRARARRAGSADARPVRAPIALALGTVALRNAPLVLKLLERDAVRDRAIELLREAFDMLEEDFDEEQFFATVRRAYWQAPAGSPARRVADTLIRKLEF